MDSENTKPSLVEDAYKEIRRRILSLDLMPGQIVSDFILSKDLGMSRTPIRQALIQLGNDGLVTDSPSGRGYEVTRITEDDVIDLFDARNGIEVTALKIAMLRGISPRLLDTLQEWNDNVGRADASQDLEQVFDSDQSFHIHLVEASGNRRIISYNSTILLQLRRMRLLSYFQKSLPHEAVGEHAALIGAIASHNVEEAVSILSAHILKTRDAYVQILKTKITSEEFGVLKYMVANNLKFTP